MLRQPIFGIALGYEDIVDHDQLRHDPGLYKRWAEPTLTCQFAAPLS